MTTPTEPAAAKRGGARPGAGRPRRAAAKQSEAVLLRLTPAEKQRLVAAAAIAGQSITQYVRERCGLG